MQYESRVLLATLLSFGVVACDKGDSAGNGDGDGDQVHGTIRVLLDRSDPDVDPFSGTSEVVLQVHYLDDCLVPFYTETHPEYAEDGEAGAPVFEAWASRLCDPTESFNANGVPCDGVEIEQVENIATESLFLRVSYQITDDDMTQRELAVGPLPTEALAECTPRVQLSGGSAIGFDDNGNQIWGIASLPSQSTAQTNQGPAMNLEIQSF